MIALPMRARYQGNPVLLGTVKMAKTSAPLDISITLPWIPDELVLNAFHHVLAQDVTVKRR